MVLNNNQNKDIITSITPEFIRELGLNNMIFLSQADIHTIRANFLLLVQKTLQSLVKINTDGLTPMTFIRPPQLHGVLRSDDVVQVMSPDIFAKNAPNLQQSLIFLPDDFQPGY